MHFTILFFIVTGWAVNKVESRIEDFVRYQGKYLSSDASTYTIPLDQCAKAVSSSPQHQAFQYSNAGQSCQFLVAVDDWAAVEVTNSWDLYVKPGSVPEDTTITTTSAPKASTTTPAGKGTACMAVALDVSESLVDRDHLVQEAMALNRTWYELAKLHVPDRYDVTVVIIPFNAVVVEEDVRTISSNSYNTGQAFLDAEGAILQSILMDIQNTATDGLTDLSAVLQYIGDLGCVADIRVAMVISDFIITKNAAQVGDKLASLISQNYKVVAVALDKQISESHFKEVVGTTGVHGVRMADDYGFALDDLFASVLGSSQ